VSSVAQALVESAQQVDLRSMETITA